MYVVAPRLWRFCRNLRLCVLQLILWFLNLYPADCPSAQLPGSELQQAGPPQSGAFGSGRRRVCTASLSIHLPVNPSISVQIAIHISIYLFVRWLGSQSQTGLNPVLSHASCCVSLKRMSNLSNAEVMITQLFYFKPDTKEIFKM